MTMAVRLYNVRLATDKRIGEMVCADEISDRSIDPVLLWRVVNWAPAQEGLPGEKRYILALIRSEQEICV